jgi:hypothetical protein
VSLVSYIFPVSELDRLLHDLDETRASRIAQSQQQREARQSAILNTEQWYTLPSLNEGEDLTSFYFENQEADVMNEVIEDTPLSEGTRKNRTWLEG